MKSGSAGILSPTNVGERGAYVTFNERPLGGHRLLLSLVAPGGRVLDVGCSSGYLAERLVRQGNVVVGIEREPEAADRAREICERVVVGDVETMAFPFEQGSFDTIVCGDLIEHLRDPTGFLERVRPFLRPGGVLALTTPNIANWTIRSQLLAGRFRYTERGILDRTHTHFFTQRTLTDCLQEAGYQVDSMNFTVPVPLIGMPFLERVAHAIGRVRPGLFAFQFVVAAHNPAP